MNRLKFHRVIVAIAMMLIGWLPSLAHHFEVDGIFYNRTSDNTVAVTYKGYTSYDYSNEYAGDVVIPSSVNYNGTTYSVTSIGEEAFYDCSSLTGIEIPNSVTSIGDDAFECCFNLASIAIPNSVTSIGDGAFECCFSLTSIEIPNSVTSIGDYAFRQCSSLTSIEIPNSVTSIGNHAFKYCSSLASVVWNAKKCSDFSSSSRPFENSPNITSFTFGDEVKHIPAYLCYNLFKLTSIQIPNSVTSIRSSAFRGCSSLTSIEIPNSVTSIGDKAFYYCTSLKSIQIPNSVTYIGGSAFAHCTSLKSIQIPNSVTSIGGSAFEGCKSLTSIEIPNSVTSIGGSAFRSCSSLTSVEIGNSVTSIGNYAFYYCWNLTKITCWATTPPTIDSDTFSNYSAELYVPTGCISAYQSANYWKNFNIIIDTLATPITLNDNNVTVASIGDYIVVKNATVGSVVRVYTADGTMIASEVTTEGDVIIEAPAKGIYVVKVGKQTVKVII